ncbi:MAG: transporter substrate-binding domain-containing protein [Vicinamibacteria bacterium]
MAIVIAMTLSADASVAQAVQTPMPESSRGSADQDKTIVYGGTSVFRPFDFLDEAGKPQGFNVELVRALARVAGYRVEVRLGDWDKTLEGVRSHEVDLVMLAYTEERTKTYDFLDEFWTVRHSILFLPGRASYPNVLLDLKKETVAVSGEAVSLQLLRALPEALRPTLIAARNNAEAIKILERGDATAVTGNALVLQTELSRMGIHDLHEVIASASSYRLATGKGREAEMAWVGPALQKLRESGEFSALVEKHLAEPRPGRTFRDRLEDAALIVLMLSLPFVLVLAWNRSLRREVESRTTQIRAVGVEKDRLAKSLAESLDQVQEANQQLELKNAELERFTFTVSHDLRSPLITIRGYLGHLEESAVAGNLELFRQDAARINRAASRMEALLRDLLALSRVGRVLSPDQDVRMSELARDTAELLHGMLSERHVQVEIQEDLPVVRGDRQRLAEVFQNLIENAAKFTAGQTDPRIWIGARKDAEVTVFTVRDNGTGIDPQHHDRVFKLFEKLTTETEGTGLGLALVRRIVEAHGGRVWVESDGLGKGSTFCFTLRLADSVSAAP